MRKVWICTVALSLAAFAVSADEGVGRARAWHDDFRRVSYWNVYGTGNPAKIECLRPHGMRLSLNHVPFGWPYTYQWSGARQEVELDIRRFPILKTNLSDVEGGSYAHLEISVLDGFGKAVKNFRSETFTHSGLITWDLGKLLDPAVYTVDLRLIVGGDNAGCSVTYDSIGLEPAPAPHTGLR